MKNRISQYFKSGSNDESPAPVVKSDAIEIYPGESAASRQYRNLIIRLCNGKAISHEDRLRIAATAGRTMADLSRHVAIASRRKLLVKMIAMAEKLSSQIDETIEDVQRLEQSGGTISCASPVKFCSGTKNETICDDEQPQDILEEYGHAVGFCAVVSMVLDLSDCDAVSFMKMSSAEMQEYLTLYIAEARRELHSLAVPQELADQITEASELVNAALEQIEDLEAQMAADHLGQSHGSVAIARVLVAERLDRAATIKQLQQSVDVAIVEIDAGIARSERWELFSLD